jgi:hypothetical protein
MERAVLLAACTTHHERSYARENGSFSTANHYDLLNLSEKSGLTTQQVPRLPKDKSLWKICESSVGGEHALLKYFLAAQRLFGENPLSS